MGLLWTFFQLLLILESVLSLAIGSDAPTTGYPAKGTSRPTLLPEDDSFYTPPEGFEDAAAGTILKHRPVPNPLTLDNVNPIRPKAAWQLLYRTQNSVGKPSASVVTVIQPWNAKSDHHFSYSYFSDAAYSGCNPSVTLQIGTLADNTFNQLQTAILVEALVLGYYVTVADYGGEQAAFSSGLQAGYATLDSIRAVQRSSNITGIAAKTITTLHGYSSGAQAVGWATELHPTYAPELQIAGAAFGGLPANISALLEMPVYQKGERAFLGPPVILGLSKDYANLSQWLDNALIPETANGYRVGDRRCVSGNHNFSNQDLGKYFKRGYNAVFEDVPISVVRDSGTMGQRATPTIPWYIYHAAGDDVSPQALTDRVVEKHCKNGANILYEKNPLPINHRLECVYGLSGAYKWMKDRHDGKPIKTGCTTVGLTDESVTGTTQALLIRGVLNALRALAGSKIGPDGNERYKKQPKPKLPVSVVAEPQQQQHSRRLNVVRRRGRR